jgi:hypothetical protein
MLCVVKAVEAGHGRPMAGLSGWQRPQLIHNSLASCRVQRLNPGSIGSLKAKETKKRF